jgi:hypothetical protein
MINTRSELADKVWKYLSDNYTPKKISSMGIRIRKGFYTYHRQVEQAFLNLCIDNNMLVTMDNYRELFIISSESSRPFIEVKSLIQFLIDKFPIDQNDINLKFKQVTSISLKEDYANFFWNLVCDDYKSHICNDLKPTGLGVSYSDETTILYFHNKGFITFDKGVYTSGRNYNYYLPVITLSLLKKIDFKVTDEVISNFITNHRANMCSYLKEKMEYLFTIPGFKERITSKKKFTKLKSREWSHTFFDMMPDKHLHLFQK